MSTADHITRHLRGVSDKLPQQSDWKFAFIIVSLVIYTVSVLYLYRMSKELKALKNEAHVLRVELNAVDDKLGSRFAYVTADMDAAKSQIRELTKGMSRLSDNAVVLVEYLKNRDLNKNAPRRR